MSTSLPPRPRVVSAKGKILIVASKYNPEYTDKLLDNVIEELGVLVPNSRTDIVRVPGAFEIPVTVDNLIETGEYACAIALGVIIKGATAHADLVAASVTTSLQELAIKYKTPVIHEVLLVENAEQAQARCIGEDLNRGREAARAAVSMLQVFNELKRVSSSRK